MATQSPPFALQNSSHSAALFRQAVFSLVDPGGSVRGGILSSGDLVVAAQSTPNMSVQVSAGRAWIGGTQVASVSGGSWSTQAAYFAINDAPLSVTITAANATNPRIDVIYVAVNDAFYSGSLNTTVIAVATGTAAASPVAPAIPSNAIALAQVAVAANATSIVSGNITVTTGLLMAALGGINPVTSTDAVAGLRTGQYRDHPTKGLQRWNGSTSNWDPSGISAYGKRLVKNGTQTITNSWVELIWDGPDVNLDPGIPGFWTSSTPGHLIAPVKGIYTVACGAEALTNIQIRLNAGGSATAGFQVTASNGGTSGPTTAYNNCAANGFQMNAGDYLQAFGFNTTSQAAGTASGYVAFFSLSLIAALP